MLSVEALMYRLGFSRRLKDNYSYEECLKLVLDYVNGIDKEYKSIYDNKDRIEKYFKLHSSIDFNNITIDIRRIKSDATELDLIDVLRYLCYYNDIRIGKIVNSLVYDIGEDDEVTVGHRVFVWNKRKNYFNEIQRGLSMYKAVDIVQNANSDDIKTIDGNTYVFGFINDDIFLVVEIDNKSVIRIKSFRRSDYKEYRKIIGE